MSAPDTNVEKQARRHRPALWGMVGAVLLAALLFVGYLLLVAGPEENGSGDVQDAVPTVLTE